MVVKAVLETSGLVKSFGTVKVLESIDIQMGQGDFLVLVGPSGCGKSTLLNCIAGLEEVSSGKISIGGRDVTAVPPRDRDIAMVFQSYALYPTMSVAENIAFGMKIRHESKDKIDAKTLEVAKLLQIEHLLDRRPAHLSGGQRQRVAMGRALVRDPALFLFDEPLSNLDAKLRVEMRAEIKRLHQNTGASIVYVTHDQIEAMTLATQIVVLNEGVIQQIGTPREIYERPANRFVADFMGAPPMNLLEAVLSDDAKSLSFGDGQHLAIDSNHDVVKGLGGQKITVGIRPEFFSRNGAGQRLSLDLTVVENAGSDAFLQVKLAGQSLTARLPGRVDQSAGEKIDLVLDTTGICYFDAQSGVVL